MSLTPADLQHITAVTLDDYQRNADSFWQGTRDHDVSQNIDCLLRHVTAPKPVILDFGCGPGRDLKRFRELGSDAVGLDGTSRFVDMAKTYSSCDVWHQDFLALDLPDQYFDGIFANATLFHVPSQELPRVLRELYSALKSSGVLFSSNPRGPEGKGTKEGWNRERYGAFHDMESWRSFLVTAGFCEIEHYYRPEGLPREQQSWLASAWRKV